MTFRVEYPEPVPREPVEELARKRQSLLNGIESMQESLKALKKRLPNLEEEEREHRRWLRDHPPPSEPSPEWVLEHQRRTKKLHWLSGQIREVRMNLGRLNDGLDFALDEFEDVRTALTAKAADYQKRFTPESLGSLDDLNRAVSGGRLHVVPELVKALNHRECLGFDIQFYRNKVEELTGISWFDAEERLEQYKADLEKSLGSLEKTEARIHELAEEQGLHLEDEKKDA